MWLIVATVLPEPQPQDCQRLVESHPQTDDIILCVILCWDISYSYKGSHSNVQLLGSPKVPCLILTRTPSISLAPLVSVVGMAVGAHQDMS